MSHYFVTDGRPLERREIRATVFGHELVFTTAQGVFSGSRLDPGTGVLLREIDPPAEGHLLDLGCGFGPIAVGLAVASPRVTVAAVDVNENALQLTRENAARHGVADRVSVGVSAEGPFDEIWSNPPIRIGKEALHELLLGWLPKLKRDGVAWLVVSKNLGGDSLARWLGEQGWPTVRVASSKGFRILKTTWPAPETP
ncbi:class I SAM-dependent methyltransferase [Tessaracoccus sp. OH4464_COT-324]|uniref:class I SAM-dependent methyltransferase n=1 Tax=Tessaracoccus sp. OH4464_COT-324 TaxID=2491059 RepID=UPI000F631B92|nr:methyltransferase [Tessaracoccus sp. OH4464_COT-324]RRD45972.1 methyltransferase domain-containing protein [Tessaracoccus sp. OH4464_COT-324]